MATAAERRAAQQAAAKERQKAALAAFAAKRKPAATSSGHIFAGNANKVKPVPLTVSATMTLTDTGKTTSTKIADWMLIAKAVQDEVGKLTKSTAPKAITITLEVLVK